MEIIPYVQNNGMWTLPDTVVMGVYEKMVKNNLTKWVFYGNEVINAEGYLRLCKAPHNFVTFVVEDKQVVFVAWLNDFNINSAFAHFCGFPETWGKSVEVATDVLKYWFGMKHKNGEYILDVVLGKTPANNKLAVKFLRKLGNTILGTIPYLAHGPDKSKRVGDVVSYITRGDVQ